MKIFILLTTILGSQLAVQTIGAAPAPNDTSSAQKRGSNASTAEPEIPLSVFVIPAEPKDGKDPFFPTSKRPYVHSKPTSTAAPVIQPAKLILNGISKKLAMINGRTFSEGEEGDVNTEGGRRHIRCVKIREETVTVETIENGATIDRQELKLRIY